jgi:hypothetical protein
MKRLNGFAAGIGAVLMVVGYVGQSRADVITFSTASGKTDTAGDSVSATATFTTGAGTVTIALQNLLIGQKDAGQLVSDLSFTISTGQDVGSINSSSSDSILINSDKTVTPNGTVAPGWALTTVGNSLHLDGLAGSANGPAQELVGRASADGKYDNANPSLRGNGPHNPFLDGTVNWVIDVAGVTSASKISSATFSFGTAAGDNVPGVGKPGGFGGGDTPEPHMLVALLGMAGMGFVGLIWRRRKHVA